MLRRGFHVYGECARTAWPARASEAFKIHSSLSVISCEWFRAHNWITTIKIDVLPIGYAMIMDQIMSDSKIQIEKRRNNKCLLVILLSNWTWITKWKEKTDCDCSFGVFHHLCVLLLTQHYRLWWPLTILNARLVRLFSSSKFLSTNYSPFGCRFERAITVIFSLSPTTDMHAFYDSEKKNDDSIVRNRDVFM